MQQLLDLVKMPTRRVLGLMSGTSLDGLDMGLFEISGSGAQVQMKQLAFETADYPADLRRAIMDAFRGDTAQLCRINVELGRFYASRCLDFCARVGQPDVIGMHGQTLWHIHGHSSLQSGESAVLAQAMGKVVIHDFRLADIAAGGAGAPLAPYLDRVFFQSPTEARAVQNLGGIGNVTFLPKDPSAPLIAFDTGPANGILNEAVYLLTHGRESFDRDGALAAQGQVDEALLDSLSAEPYFAMRPPKSTGREDFGRDYVQRIISRWGHLSHADLLCSLTALVARSIARAYKDFLPRVERVYLCGGGQHNPLLVAQLTQALAPRMVEPLPVVPAFDGDSKEAAFFALFAHERLNGHPTNVPEVTGAKRLVSMGKITLPD
ncbi:MAG: anhydro-N-acetylmuramic acid kinase [bacterium]|nr:anhydro-N-acetylmuramic acid kinase [bacterium]